MGSRDFFFPQPRGTVSTSHYKRYVRRSVMLQHRTKGCCRPTNSTITVSPLPSFFYIPLIRFPSIVMSTSSNSDAIKNTAMTQAMWDAAAPIIAVTEQHPFLVAMVDGTLSMEAFQYYVVQDALYLADFANCLLRLSQNSNISELDSQRLKTKAHHAQEAELMLHEGFFVQWQINTTGVEQMPYSLLYTSYMERIVATRSHAEGLAVLLPCFWVYMHVGKKMLELRKNLGESVQRPPQFDAWIDMYGGDDFETSVLDYIDLVEKACQKADKATLQQMQKHFLISCKLEHMFWDQALTRMTWPTIIPTVTLEV